MTSTKSKSKPKLQALHNSKAKSKVSKQSKKKLPLEIDLNVQINPHPNIKKAYADVNALDDFFPFWDERSEYRNEARIFLFANAGQNKRPIKHKIVSIYRKKEQHREVCFLMEHLSTTDVFGNYLDWTRTIGRYEHPHLNVIAGYNPNAVVDPNQPPELASPNTQSVQISNIETKYLWEWDKIKPQLLKWYDEGIIDENTRLTAWVGTRKYTVQSWDQFISLSVDDLVLLAQVGLKASGLFQNPQEVLAMAKQVAKTELEKMMKTSNRDQLIAAKLS